jgi:hypothetical protein
LSLAEKVTYADALSGRGIRLAAIGVGSFGIGELCAKRFGIAVPCLLLAVVLIAGFGAALRGRRAVELVSRRGLTVWE